jgi:hypothetical protein
MRIERWATPATIGTFAVTAITGLFMFFHLQTGWMKTAHEWVGWLAVAAAVFHTLVHWRAFKMHFANKLGLSVIMVFLAAGILSAIPSSGKRPGNPARQVITAIEQASINAVSPVTGHTPEILTEQLKAAGIVVQEPDQTIRQIAQQNHRSSVEILGIIFDEPSRAATSPDGSKTSFAAVKPNAGSNGQ